jgi:hypothetical protein
MARDTAIQTSRGLGWTSECRDHPGERGEGRGCGEMIAITSSPSPPASHPRSFYLALLDVTPPRRLDHVVP